MSLKLKDEDSTKRMKDMQEELKDTSSIYFVRGKTSANLWRRFR